MQFKTNTCIGLLICVGLFSCETSSPDDLLTATDDDLNTIVTYENTVKNILDNSCVMCHSGPNANAGVMLDTYLNARNVAESGRMIIRMTSDTNPMPPSGNLPDATISSIMQWIDDGLLEN